MARYFENYNANYYMRNTNSPGKSSRSVVHFNNINVNYRINSKQINAKTTSSDYCKPYGDLCFSFFQPSMGYLF